MIALDSNGHGAYTDEPFHALLTDVTAFTLGDGAAQIQKIVIGRDYFG